MSEPALAPRADWTGALLAGGRARRMGRDKLLLPLDGARLIDRPAAALRATCAELSCVGRELDLAGFRALPDARRDCGPLGGLVAALEDASTAWILAVAGDLPELTAAFLRQLQEAAEQQSGAALVPLGPHGPEPLLAAWPRAAAVLLRRRLEDRKLALHEALAELPHRLWAPPPAAKMPAPWRNLNAPEDWEAFTGRPLPRPEIDRA